MRAPRLEPDQVLTVFPLGSTYLMIEGGGLAKVGRKTEAENPITLRLSVESVDDFADRLRQIGTDVVVRKFE